MQGRSALSASGLVDGGPSLHLPFDGPLEWETMLSYFRARAIPGVEHVTEHSYRRTVVIDGEPGAIELTRGGLSRLDLRARRLVSDHRIQLAQRARSLFSLDARVERPVAHLSRDPVIGPIVAGRPGLRVPGAWDPFETGVRAIIGQQVSVPGANTLIGRLVRRLGRPVAGFDALGLSHLFPTSAVVAGADLTGLGLTRARALAIRDFARAVAGGEVALERGAGLEQLVAAITAIRGLGPWTAHYVALRMGQPDAFPAGDLGLRRAIRSLSPDGAPPLAELAGAWSPWRATAAVHLWHVAVG